jgi:virginiamycin A acetyltransferase
MPDPRPFARPDAAYPIILPDGTADPGTVYLAAVIDHPRIEVGAYTYASAHHPPADWAAHLAPYTYPFSPEKLVIGRFCQIADGAVFVTASANHRRDGISTYPFAIFGGGGAAGRPSLPGPGPDTVIGHDVWIGARATILPGARIGPGCIIGAGAVVGGSIPPYSVVAGNPGRVIRARFDGATVAQLLDLAWWDWPIDRILQAEAAICGGDIAALERLTP